MAKNTPIKLYRSAVAGNVPTTGTLGYGELALNYTDGRLYFRDSSDNIRALASPSSFLLSGEYRFDSATTAADPGTGDLRLNNSTRASTTALYFDSISDLGTDASLIINSLVAGDLIVLQDKASASDRVRYRVTGTPTDNSGWWTVPVSWVSEAGALWANNTILAVMVQHAEADAVQSVFGRTGAVVAATNDYTWAQINKTGSSLADLTIKSASDLTSGVLPDDRMPDLTGDVTSAEGSVATTIANNAVTLGKMADMATSSLIYRKTAGTGDPEVNTLATLKTDLGLTGTNSGDQTISLTGDVTGSGTGSFAATIANDAVSFAKMQNSAAAGLSVVGRSTNSAGDFAEIAAGASGDVLWRNVNTVEFAKVNSTDYHSWIQSSESGPTDSTTWVPMFSRPTASVNGTATLAAGIHYVTMKFRMSRTGSATATILQMQLDSSSTTLAQWGLFVKTYVNLASSTMTSSATTLDSNVLYWGTSVNNPSSAQTISTSIGDGGMVYEIDVHGVIVLTSTRTITPAIKFASGSGFTTTKAWSNFWNIHSVPSGAVGVFS